MAADALVGLGLRPNDAPVLCLQVAADPFAPVLVGDIAPPPTFFGPIVDLNTVGLAACACREKAPKHCKTCAGSLFSYRSTVRKRSWAGMLSGSTSQAFRKWLIFSIWMNGIGLLLNLIPGDGRTRLASLHSATPSLSASKRSPGGRCSLRVSSIHARTSFAA